MSLSTDGSCDVPWGNPPAGQTSNFVDPETLRPAAFGVTLVATAWAVAVSVIRLYVNRKRWMLAEYFVAIAVVLQPAYCGLVLTLSRWSRHLWDIPECWFTTRYVKLLYAEVMLYSPVVYFAKTSIFLLFLQIFSIERGMRIAIWGGIVFTTLNFVVTIPLVTYYMIPLVDDGQTWADLVAKGPTGYFSWSGVVQGLRYTSLPIDLYIFLLPLPVLARLNLSMDKKLGLMAIFGTALMGVAASAVAVWYRSLVMRTTDSDVTWSQSIVMICNIVEIDVALVVSSMPPLSNFWRKLILESRLFKGLWPRRFFGSKNSSSVLPGPFINTWGQGPERRKRSGAGDDSLDSGNDMIGLWAERQASARVTATIPLREVEERPAHLYPMPK